MDSIQDYWWTNGLCSVFAARLRQRFGGELWAVVNHSRKYDHDELWHVYCVVNGIAYDANGAHAIDEVSDVAGIDVPEIDANCDVVFQWRFVDEVWLRKVHEDYDPSLFPAVDEYIARHAHLFIDLL